VRLIWFLLLHLEKLIRKVTLNVRRLYYPLTMFACTPAIYWSDLSVPQ